MTDKHLLFWVFKAIDLGFVARETLLNRATWEKLGAPDWVLPAMRERYGAFEQAA